MAGSPRLFAAAAAAHQILERCRDALRGEARLLLPEWPVPERCGPQDGGMAGTDLNMLVVCGGVERTLAGYRALRASAGLRVTRVLPTPVGMHVIEAVRASLPDR